MSKTVKNEKPDLSEMCAYWQPVLRLSDWQVFIRYARARDMDGEKQGECKFFLSSKQARIQVLDPVDYPETCIEPQNIENTVVHELLHLHFITFFDHDVQEERDVTAMEQVINILAGALLNKHHLMRLP